MEQEGREYVRPEIDKREHRRARLVTQLKCEASGRDELLLSRDVSVGGMFVTAKNPFAQDSEVTIIFRVTPVEPLISCRGKVMYAIQGVGIGIMFSELNDESRKSLQKFIDAAD